MLKVFYLDVAYIAKGWIAAIYCFIYFEYILQSFYLSVANVDHSCGERQSPQWSSCCSSLGVAKMEAVGTRVVGTGCRDELVGMWSRMNIGGMHWTGWT
jgi:hypothetical protein